MADKLDPKDFSGISRDVRETSKEMKDMIKSSAALTDSARTLSAELDDILQINRRRTLDERELLSISQSILKSTQQNFELSRKGRTLDKEKFKIKKAQSDIERELTSLQGEVLANSKKDKQANEALLKIAQKISNAESARLGLIEKSLTATGEQKEDLEDRLKINQNELDSLKSQSSTLDSLISNESKRVVFLNKSLLLSNRVLDSIEKQESFQREVNQVTGITGELLEGVNRIGLRVLGGLGVNLGVISDSFEKGRSAMTEFGKEVARTRDLEKQLSILRALDLKAGKDITEEVAKELNLLNEKGELLTGIEAAKKAEALQQELIRERANSTNDIFARTQALVRGINAFSSELGGILTDPGVVIAVMVKHFGELNKASVQFQRLTGQTPPILDTLNTRLATSVQYLELSSTLSERFGMNIAAAFSPQNLAAASELMNLMGITAEQAGQLALMSELNRTTVNATLSNIVDQVNAYNKNNRTALNHGQIVNDIAKASEDTLASLVGQPAELTRAAAAARRLGMELSQIESIANTLLDFESSIENELQAQLLTGMNINLNKARELALTNDIGQMSEEIFKSTVEVEEFSRLNRIAQEGLAQALGMSRKELAKIALQRSTELGLTNQALEAAAGVTAEDLKRLETMELLNLSIQKIGQSLALPAELLAGMLSNAAGLYTAMTLLTGLVVTRTVLAAKSLALQLVKAGVAASVVRAGLTGFAGLAAIGAAAGLATYLMNREPEKVKDGIINPDGGLMVSGPKGSIQLDPQDSIIAGTNLGGQGGGSNQQAMELIRKMDELISAVKQGGDVYLDSDKVGTALVKGTYRNS